MNFQWLQELLTILGNPNNAALIQKLVTLGVDVTKVAAAVAEKQGVTAIVAAIQQLVTDAEAAAANTVPPANPSVG